MTFNQGYIVSNFLQSGPIVPMGEPVYVNIGLNHIPPSYSYSQNFNYPQYNTYTSVKSYNYVYCNNGICRYP